MKIEIRKDPGALAEAVAQELVRISHEQPAGGPRAAVALSGGSTPKRMYEVLARPPLLAQVAWDRLELFFGDERAVPMKHPDSNFGVAKRALFDKAPVRAHRMRAEADADLEYEALIKEHVVTLGAGALPCFELILLGVGSDGHTASLFPGTAALKERSRLVVMNEVPQLRTRRMTFTYPLLNAAKRIFVLVTGAEKKDLVRGCLNPNVKRPSAESWPILGVQPVSGKITFWLDEPAAEGLRIG